MNIDTISLKINELQKIIDVIRLELDGNTQVDPAISDAVTHTESTICEKVMVVDKSDVIKKLTEVHTVFGKTEIVGILQSFDSAKSVSDIPVELYGNLIEKCDLVLAGGEI